jgi:opacity protein-like surface antigen
MKGNMGLLALLTSVLTGSVFAGTMGIASQSSNRRWVSTLSVGPVWEQAGKTQSFYLTPEIEKTYAAHQSTNTLADGELFVGMQQILSKSIQAQLGLALVATSDASLSGFIWDDEIAPFANHSYRYKIQHSHVAVKTKLLIDKGYWLTPWISGSLGIGFNTAHAFQNTPLIYEAVVNPNFAAHTQIAFTYRVGAGVQKALNQHWQVGVGYEFADWGQSRLGPAAEQTLNNRIELNHLYTNGILFNLTYCS